MSALAKADAGPALSPQLSEKVQQLLHKYGITGFSISVVQKKSGEWVEGVTTMGIRDVAGNPWESNSIHAIASSSKVFVAASIGILIDRGTTLPNGEKLSWNTKIKSILPDWRMMDKNTEENADIEDALCLPANTLGFSSDGETASSWVERMRYHKPAAPLRKAAIYVNDGFTLVGEVIAKLTGQPYHVFAKENILEPLGMTDSGFDREAALKTGKRVEGFLHYGRDVEKAKEALVEGKWVKEPVGQLGATTTWNKGDAFFFSAAGGILTTGTDILRWLKETLDPQILPQSTLDELNRPRQAFGSVEPPHPSVSMNFYGLGQVTSYYRGHRIVGHGGGIPGHQTQVLRLPDDDIALAFFCNDDTHGHQMISAVIMMVVDGLLGLDSAVDWEEVFITKGLKEEPSTEEPPSSPRPSPDLTGNYHHPSFGPLLITRIEEHSMGSIYSDLLNEHPGNTIRLPSSAQVYLGDLQHDWAGRFVFVAHDGPIFTRGMLRAEEIQLMGGEGGTRRAGYLWFQGKCVGTDEGIGMFEDFWGQGGAVGGMTVSRVVEEDVEEKSEVWFRKI